MTSPLPLFDNGKLSHFRRLESRFGTRDLTAELIHQVRRGNIRQLFPEELDFSISFEGSPIANFVDIVAHDMSEGIAPLPSLACTSGKMQTESDLKRAQTKNRIGDNYWRQSKLEIQMLKGADRYVTYGFLPFFVEPRDDKDVQMPYVHVEDPRHAYYELDRFGRTKVYAKRLLKTVDELCALFPEYSTIIRKDKDTSKDVNGDTLLKMVRWIDCETVTLFLPERNGLTLSSYQHKLSRCPVKIAERPSEDDNPRGQFDDVIWVQVARSIMSTLALEAASIAVQAPIAIPEDMDELSIGPHAIMQSANAKDIHKVALEMPPQIFAENQLLDQEMKLGARYPDARTGGVQGASVITGKGVEALLGTFDSQIKGAQMIMREALEEVTAICFEMDEAWWPNKTQTVNGTVSGSSYEFSYTPSKDINGRYACTVTYGFASGLSNPSQAAVMMLQLEGAGVISKHTMRDNLPMPMDGITEERSINVEASREALKQGIFALIQATGQMAAQGQDPNPIIHMSVDMIKALQDGKSVEDAVSEAYDLMAQRQQQAQQQAQEEQQEAAQQGGAPGGAPGGPPGSFDGANGAPEAGVPGDQAPGQAGLPPGGRPAVADMIAGFRGNGNLPINQFAIRRSVPTGT
jgi:hypothetical protein